MGGYHTGLGEAILRMKLPSHEALALAMGQLLALRRQEELEGLQADIVIPIPMFWTRRVARGINSPDVLARCLAVSLEIPLRRDVLVKHRNTLPQHHLPPSERFRNVRGAFRLRRGQTLASARVLLVDVFDDRRRTCSEAAKVLKQAGASSVAVAVIARARALK